MLAPFSLWAAVCSLQLATAAGVPVLLDAGGVDAPLSDGLLQHISTISPNETELQRLTGQQADTVDQTLAAAATLQQRAAQLADLQPQSTTQQGGSSSGQDDAEQEHPAGGSGRRQLQVLVKRGSAGSLMVDVDGQLAAQQAAVAAAQVVDTTGTVKV